MQNQAEKTLVFRQNIKAKLFDTPEEAAEWLNVQADSRNYSILRVQPTTDGKFLASISFRVVYRNRVMDRRYEKQNEVYVENSLNESFED